MGEMCIGRPICNQVDSVLPSPASAEVLSCDSARVSAAGVSNAKKELGAEGRRSLRRSPHKSGGKEDARQPWTVG